MLSRALCTISCLITFILSLTLRHALGESEGHKCYSFDSYRNQAGSYTACPIDHRDVDVTLNRPGCNFTMTMKDENCSSLCKKIEICGQILDAESGTVMFTFPFFNHNNYKKYKVSLCDQSWVCKYSRYTHLEYCEESFCKENCSKFLNVVFQFVKHDNYFIQLLPYVDDRNSLQAIKSSTVEIKTSHQDLTPLMTNACRNTTCTVRIGYQTCPAGFILKLFYKQNVLLKCEAKSSIQDIVCQTLVEGVKLNAEGACSLDNDLTISCTFSNLREESNYSVIVQPEKQLELKSDGHTLKCKWEHYFKTHSKKPPETDSNYLQENILPIVSIFLLGAFIVVIVRTGLWRIVPINKQVENEPIKPKPMAKRPCILLLYAKDCRLFMQAVCDLKLVLSTAYNCKVVDFWEHSQYSVVSQNPSRWLLSRLADRRVMVMFITNLPSLLQEAALLRGETITYRNPTAFDSLFTYGLSKLHESATSCSNLYRRVLVVRLVEDEESRFPNQAKHISPATRYVLPIHLNTLITTLFNLNPGVSIDTAEDQSVNSLTKAISEYRKFLEEKPHYFYDMFLPEQKEMIQQILSEAS